MYYGMIIWFFVSILTLLVVGKILGNRLGANDRIGNRLESVDWGDGE